MSFIESLSEFLWGPAPVAPLSNRAPEPPATQSRADSLTNALSGLGLSGDKGASARPDVYRIPLSIGELNALYRYNGLARRIVRIVPQEGTRKGWRVADSTPGASPMASEDERLHVRARVRDAWCRARHLGGALILPVLDEDCPADLAGAPDWRRRLALRPIDYSLVRSVRSLLVVGRTEASPASWETDPAEPGYGSPRTWWVSPEGGSASLEVHASRVLYFPGSDPPAGLRRQGSGFQDSVLESCWDSLRDKTSIRQVGATIAQQLTIATLRLANFDGKAVGDAAAAIMAQVKGFMRGLSVNNLALLGGASGDSKGDEFEVLNSPVTGYQELNDAAWESLSADTGIPIPILAGRAPGGLNADGESHRASWNQVVADEQTAELQEPLRDLYRLLYRARLGPTGGQEPTRWAVEFLPLDEPGAKEVAEIEEIRARTDAIYAGIGAVSAQQIARARLKGGLGNSARIELTDAEIAAIPVALSAPAAPQPQPTPNA